MKIFSRRKLSRTSVIKYFFRRRDSTRDVSQARNHKKLNNVNKTET